MQQHGIDPHVLEVPTDRYESVVESLLSKIPDESIQDELKYEISLLNPCDSTFDVWVPSLTGEQTITTRDWQVVTI